MKPITLAGFERTFAADPDPWRTFRDRDEAVKRAAILHAMGPGPWGRVLEVAAGNGSNSDAIAPRALRLDATEATGTGVALVKTVLAARAPRARAIRLAVPSRFPRETYDAIVVAELIYYLSARDMKRTARDVARALHPGGALVLAHHQIDFHDFAQHARHLQHAFIKATGRSWRVRIVRRTGRWIVLRATRLTRRSPMVSAPLPRRSMPSMAFVGRMGAPRANPSHFTCRR